MITLEEPKEKYSRKNEFQTILYKDKFLLFWNNENSAKYQFRDINIRPFSPKIITYNNMTYTLINSMKCLVTIEDNMFIIRNELLDITVWGEDQDSAEEAFYFTFNAIYINYVKEKEENLSDKAIILKHNINNLIASIN